VDLLLKRLRLSGRALAERTALAAKLFGIHEHFIKAIYLETVSRNTGTTAINTGGKLIVVTAVTTITTWRR